MEPDGGEEMPIPSLPQNDHTPGDSMPAESAISLGPLEQSVPASSPASTREDNSSDQVSASGLFVASDPRADGADQQDTSGLGYTLIHMSETQEIIPDILPTNVENHDEGQSVVPSDKPVTGRLLSVDDKLRETIEDRRAQANAKGALARARLRLQGQTTNYVSGPSKASQENGIVSNGTYELRIR